MSNLSEFIGGGIKSVQTGTTATGNTATNLTINAVDTAKSFICINGTNTNNVGYTQYGRAELFDSTTVRFSRVSNNGAGLYTIYWSVVEYY